MPNGETVSGASSEEIGLVLPCQFHAYWGSCYVSSGEQLLVLAVLTDAVDIFLNGSRDQLLFRQTCEWISEAHAEPATISFNTACEALGLEAARLRSRLLQMKLDRSSPDGGARQVLWLKSRRRSKRRERRNAVRGTQIS